MHKSRQEVLSKKLRQPLSRWDDAISEAERLIKETQQEARQRIATLRQSIKTFEAARDKGMEFPEPKARHSLRATK